MPRKRKRTKPERHIILSVIRWLARLSSLASITLMFIIFNQADLHPPGLPVQDLILFICFPIGVSLGFIIAWGWERPGAIVSLLSFAVFCVLYFVFKDSVPTEAHYLAALLFPALLFLTAGIISNRT